MTKTRKIVLSPGYGAGIASWNAEKGYAVIEHPALVAYIEAGGRDPDECQRICEEAGLLEPGEYFCWLGLREAEVVTVTPPYRVEEYDGYESVIEASDPQGWRG